MGVEGEVVGVELLGVMVSVLVQELSQIKRTRKKAIIEYFGRMEFDIV